MDKRKGRLGIPSAVIASGLLPTFQLGVHQSNRLLDGGVYSQIAGVEQVRAISHSQRRMIAALNKGEKPDERLSARAKLRSKQNTFMAVPVVFIMISNHYPGVTYGERYNWLILSGLVLAGWIAAKFIRRA